MPINTNTFESNLTTKINATSGTTDAKEFLLLGKAIEAVTPSVVVQDVIDEGTTQTTAVNTAGTTQVTAVNTAGTTQVGLVQTEGATQVAALQAAGSSYATLSGSTFTGTVNGTDANLSGDLVVTGSITAADFVGVVTSTVITEPTINVPASVPKVVGSSVTFSATPGVAGSSIASFTYTVEGGSATTVNATNNAATVSLSAPSGAIGDNYVITAFATDSLGNTGETATNTSVIVDVQVAAPTVTGNQATLTTSAYSATGNAATTHGSTSWQISTDSGFSTIFEESLNDATNLTSYSPTSTFAVGTTYYVRAAHIDANNVQSSYSATYTFVGVAVGEASFTTAGQYNWTAPAGVTSISVVCIGGGGGGAGDHDGAGGCAGGLGYKNNITVTPGTTYSLEVGSGGSGGRSDLSYGNGGSDSFFNDGNSIVCRGNGGPGGYPNTATGAPNGGTYVGDGGGNGGGQDAPNQSHRSGGAGAGGYAGDGATAQSYNYTPQQPASGSGAGGHGGANNNWLQAGGGGVGILGIGADGVSYGSATNQNPPGASYNYGIPGEGGSGGGDGFWVTSSNVSSAHRGNGGLYGAGGGSSFSGVFDGGDGGGGAVRIIWGPGRSFPNNAT